MLNNDMNNIIGNIFFNSFILYVYKMSEMSLSRLGSMGLHLYILKSLKEEEKQITIAILPVVSEKRI